MQTAIYWKEMERFLNNLKKGSNILDLGCGTGRFSIKLAKMGFNVTALDGCARNLKILERESEKRGFAIKTINSELHDLSDMDANSFDAIIALESICYTEHYRKALEEMKRVSKPGCVWLISVENFIPSLICSPDIKVSRQMESAIEKKELHIPFSVYVKYFDADSLRSLLAEFCEVVRIKDLFLAYDGILEKFSSERVEKAIEKKEFRGMGRALFASGIVKK
jgi:ubiquinone/menaquinone biosynthesis C-methylase UbiE